MNVDHTRFLSPLSPDACVCFLRRCVSRTKQKRRIVFQTASCSSVSTVSVHISIVGVCVCVWFIYYLVLFICAFSLSLSIGTIGTVPLQCCFTATENVATIGTVPATLRLRCCFTATETVGTDRYGACNTGGPGNLSLSCAASPVIRRHSDVV